MRTHALVAASVFLALPARAALAQELPPPVAPPPSAFAPAPYGPVAPFAPLAPPRPAPSGRRPGLWIPGVVVTVLGALATVGSVPFLVSGAPCNGAYSGGGCADTGNAFTVLGAITLGVGVAHLAVGIPLIVAGASDRNDAVSPVPSIAAGPSGVRLSWAF